MSQLLTPANLDDVIKPVSIKKSSDFTKTQKNPSKLSGILKTLQEMDDEDTTNLGDFSPPPKPISSGTQKTTDTTSNYGIDDSRPRNSYVNSVTSRSPGLELNNLKHTYPTSENASNYYSKYIPDYPSTQLNPPPTRSSDYNKIVTPNTDATIRKYTSPNTDYGSGAFIDKALSDKLNYMIHLLEDKQDVKSNSRLEEIGLYCLLGVFTIFLVDSFAKVGKYVR